MTDMYDQMREEPDRGLADALRVRLHARLDGERTQFDDPMGPARWSTARDAIQLRIDEPNVTEPAVTTEPTVDVIMLSPDRSKAPSTNRRWRMVAAAVAALALALVGGLIFAGTRADQEPVPADEREPTLSNQWSRVAHDGAVFGGVRSQVMTSVVAGGPGLVAVGHDGLWDDGPGEWAPDTSAAVWTSEDGIVWSRVPHDEEIFGGAAMNDVTLGGPGLVAVGWSPSGDAAVWDGARGAAVWTSVDGLTWSRVHDDSFSAPSLPDPERADSAMNSVVVGGPGLVAVGSAGGAAAAVWTSVDGLTWSRVPHDREIFGSPTALGFGMNSVTAGGPGLVAVGAWGEQPGIDGKVWTSADGLTWTRVPDDEAVFGGAGAQLLRSVAAGGPGLVAVGVNEAGVAVWNSVDGFDWVQVPGDEAIAGADLAINDVIAVGQGLVAVGSPGSSDGDLGAAVWTSVDGISWSRVPHDASVFGGPGAHAMLGVTPAGPNLIAVGSHQTSMDLDAAVWVATPRD